MAVPATVTAVPADDMPDHLVPQSDMPDGAVPDSDMPDHLAAPVKTGTPTMVIQPEKAPTPKPMMSQAARLGTGMLDPVVGTAQTLSHLVPDPLSWMGEKIGLKSPHMSTEAGDKFVQDREADIQATTPPQFHYEGGGVTLDEKGRASINAATKVDDKTDPTRLVGNMVSPMNLAVPSKALGAASFAGRVGSAALQGATIGAMQPVSNPGDFATQKAIQTGMGAITGGAVPAIGTGARWATNEGVLPLMGDKPKALAKWAFGLHGPEAAENPAVQGILDRIYDRGTGKGPLFQDMLDIANANPNKPLVLGDVGGPGVMGLMGKISREPGEAKDIIERFIVDRDIDATTRVTKDIADHLGGGAAFDAQQTLIDERSAAAKPLFAKADEGGSIAPLERQFELAHAEAGKVEKEAMQALSDANQRVTNASAKQSRAGETVYSTSAANQEMREAQTALSKAAADVHAASEAKAEILENLRLAQADGEAGKPGAIWSPAIDRWLKNPRIRTGIARGIRIERDEADAALRPMNIAEYAIKTDENGAMMVDNHGEPIVSRVPTFRLLRVAKQGMDAMLMSDEYRIKQTGKLNMEGVALEKLRNSFADELKRLNPDYAPALDSWSGHSQSMEALWLGQDVFKMEPEAVKDAFGKLTANDKEFFRLGAANTMRKMVQQTGEKGDETRRLIGNVRSQRQMRAMFDSQAEFDKFFSSLNAEKMMFKTWAKTYGGSQTAERQAEDFGPDVGKLGHIAKAAQAIYHLNPGAALSHGAHLLGDHFAKGDPVQRAAQAKLLTTPVPEAVARLRAAAAGMPPPRHLTPALVPAAVNQMQPDMRGQFQDDNQ